MNPPLAPCRRISPRFGLFSAGAIASLLMLVGGSAFAQTPTKDWSGTTGDWGTGANWSASGVPTAANPVQFGGTPTVSNIFLGGASRSIWSLTFDTTTPVTIALRNSFSSGDWRTLTIGASAATTDTVGISVLQGSHTIVGTGNSGELSFGAGASGPAIVWDVANGSTLTLNAKIGGNRAYKKTGAGTVVLARSNAGSGAWQFGANGPFDISEGTIRMSANSASGHSANSWTVASGATLELASATAYTSGTLALNGNGVGGVGALHASTNSTIGAGTLVLASNATIGVDNGATLTIQREITGPGNLVKAGGGLLTLSGTMQFTIEDVGINNMITGDGPLQMDGVFVFNLAGAGTTFGDSWTIVDSESATYGAAFSVSGFTNNGDLWTFGNYQFSEATGVLQVVPEPTTAAFLLGSAGLVLLSRFRRRSR